MINDTISIGSLEVNQTFGGGTDWWVEKKPIENRGFQEIHLVWLKVSLLRKMENSTMIVSTQLLEGDVCTIYSLLPEHSEDLKDLEFSWRKKPWHINNVFSFWLTTLSLNAVQELSYWSLQDCSATPYFRQGIRTWLSQWLPSCYGWHGGGLSFGKVALNHVWRSC